MQLAIRSKIDPKGKTCIFSSASDCSYYLGKKPNYVARKMSSFYRQHRTFKGLELSDYNKSKYIIVACENRGIVYNEEFNYNWEWYYHYGKTIILRSASIDKIYTFKSYGKCCAFLGRARNYFSVFKEQRTTVTSKLTNEKFFIIQFKLNARDYELYREYKSEELRIDRVRKKRNERYQKVSKLLDAINAKYNNLIEAYDDGAPEFFELQWIENSKNENN